MNTPTSYKPNYVRELLLIACNRDTTPSSFRTAISTCWDTAKKLMQSNESLAQELYNSLIRAQVSASKIRQYSPEVILCLTQKCAHPSKMTPQELAAISQVVKEALGQTITSHDAIATQTALWKLYATVTTQTLAARPIPMYIPPEGKIREIIACISENFRSVFPGTCPTELFPLLESWPEEHQIDIVIAYCRSNQKTAILKILQALNEKQERLTFPEKADTLAWIAEHFPHCFTPDPIIEAIACLPHQNRQTIIEQAGKLSTELYRSNRTLFQIPIPVTFAITAISKQPPCEQVALFTDWCQLASSSPEYLCDAAPSAIELLSHVPAKERQGRIKLLLEASPQKGHLPSVHTCSFLIADCISEDTSQEELRRALSLLFESSKPLPNTIAFFPPRSRMQILIQYLENQDFSSPWNEEAASYTTHRLEHFEEDRKGAFQLATSLAKTRFSPYLLAEIVLTLLQLDDTVYARIKQQAESINSTYIPPSSAKIDLMLTLQEYEEKEIDKVIELIRPLLAGPNGKTYFPSVPFLITILAKTAPDKRATLIQSLTIAVDSYGADFNANAIIPKLLYELKKVQELLPITTFIEAVHFVGEINKKATPKLIAYRFAQFTDVWSWFIMEMDDSTKRQAYTLTPFFEQSCQENNKPLYILGTFGCLLPPEKRMQALQNLNPDISDLDVHDFVSNCISDRTLISRDELHNFLSKQLDKAALHEITAGTFSDLFIRFQNELDLSSEHPLFLRAIEIRTFTDPDRRNPYTLFKELQRQRNVIPADTIAYKKEKVGTTTFRIDLQGIRDHAATKSSYCFSDLPKGIAHGFGPDFLDTLFAAFDARLDHLSEDQKQATHAYIREQFRIPYDELKPHLLQKPLIKHLLTTALKPQDSIEQVHFELFSILDVLQRRQNCLNDHILSEQEECLLSLACQLQECSTGQRDGIQLIYNNLVSTGEIKSTLHLDSDFEHEFKTQLHQIVQNELNHILTSSNLLSELIGKNSDSQLSHQTLYLKNRLYKELGLHHSLTFDPHSMMICPELLDIDEKEAIGTIVAKLDIQKILRRSQESLKTMMSSRTTVYNAVYALFEHMANKPEDWQQAWLLFDENYQFQGVSDEGLARLLEHMAIFKETSQ